MLLLCMVSASTSQQLNRQMAVDTLYESQKINPEPDKAYLHVRSQAPNLRFESNRNIDKSNKLSSGDWELWLPSGTHILKIIADGFQRLELPATTFSKKRSYELVLKVLGFAPTSRADENLIEVTFALNQDSVYSSYGDFTPILSHGKSVTYKMPKGEYVFRFQKPGFADQTQTVKFTQSQQIVVELKPGQPTGESLLKLPGYVRITTDPVASEIILNGQKIGTSPYQAEVTAGTHQLEIRKPLYYPDVSTFTVEEGKSVAINRSLKPRFGYLTVTGDAPGGKVLFDGKEIGALPLAKKEIESGKHAVSVEAPLYHAYSEQIDVKDGEEKTVAANLRPAFGSFDVTSAPEDSAEVFIDGVRVGVTPFHNAKMASGKYILKLQKELYSDAEEEIVIADSQNTTRAVTLSKGYGTLTITSSECNISLDGRPVGTGSYHARMKPGKYVVRVERPGPYKPIEQEVFVALGEEKNLNLQSEGRLGALSVMVEPMEAGDAEVYLNSELKGNAPLALKLLMGDYQLMARKTGFLDQTQAVTVEENQTKKVNLTMLTYEGSRQATGDRWGRVKWISGVGGLLAGGATVYFKMQSNDYYDRYSAATTSDDAASFRDKTNSNDQLFKIALGAASGLLTTAIVSWIIQGTY